MIGRILVLWWDEEVVVGSGVFGGVFGPGLVMNRLFITCSMIFEITKDLELSILSLRNVHLVASIAHLVLSLRALATSSWLGFAFVGAAMSASSLVVE
jgi:hypothetical protein